MIFRSQNRDNGTLERVNPNEKDRGDLDLIVQHADIVGYSFVQMPEDISLLLSKLDVRRATCALQAAGQAWPHGEVRDG